MNLETQTQGKFGQSQAGCSDLIADFGVTFSAQNMRLVPVFSQICQAPQEN